MSIFVSIKRLFKHSAVYGIGHIITRSIGFLLLPLYTNVFPRDEYGVAGLMFTYLAIMLIFYTYGLDAAFFRYYILEKDNDKRKTIFSTAFFMVLTTSVLFSGLIILWAGFIAKSLFSADIQVLNINLAALVRVGAGILAFDALGFLPFLILRAQEKSIPFVVYKFINILIVVASNIYFLGYLKTGIEGIFYANLLASAFTFFMLLPVSIKNLALKFSQITLKDLFAFGLPYLPSTLSVVIMDTIDRVFLERLADVEAVGLYNAGAKLGMFMALFVAAYRFAWHPFFLSTSKQENAKVIFSKVFTYVVLACVFVFIFISLFIDNIAQFSIGSFHLIGESFWESTVVVPVIMLAYILYAVYVNFLIGIYLYKKTKYLPLITVAGMLGNVIANYFLIPHYGIMGAAWARPIAYFIMAVSLYFVSRKFYQIDYEWKRIVLLSVLTAVVFVISRFSIINTNLLYKFILLVSFPILLYITGFFHKEEISKIKSILSVRKVSAGGRS